MASRQLLIPVLAGVLALPVALRADDERLKTAETVLKEMAGAGDKGVSEGLIQKAKCIVIIPGVKKGAIRRRRTVRPRLHLVPERRRVRLERARRHSHRGREHRLADWAEPTPTCSCS